MSTLPLYCSTLFSSDQVKMENPLLTNQLFPNRQNTRLHIQLSGRAVRSWSRHGHHIHIYAEYENRSMAVNRSQQSNGVCGKSPRVFPGQARSRPSDPRFQSWFFLASRSLHWNGQRLSGLWEWNWSLAGHNAPNTSWWKGLCCDLMRL